MKIYKTDEFIEKLNISSIQIKGLNNLDFYKYYPKTKEELRSIIEYRIKNEGLSCNLNDIDVSKIENMSDLFNGSDFVGDISKWDVSKVTDMSGMFYYSNFNGDISNWDVSNVKNMYGMFSHCEKFDCDLSNWDVSNVETMQGMFSNSKFNGNISNWNVSNVKQYKDMFKNCPLKTQLEKQPKFNN